MLSYHSNHGQFKSMRSIVWNPPKAECNQGGAVYGIKTQGTYTFGDHIRLTAIPYTHSVITYQPCGLDRKKQGDRVCE